jgi:hypothetical protein
MSDATQASKNWYHAEPAARSSWARPMGCCSTSHARHIISVYYAVLGPIPVLLGCPPYLATNCSEHGLPVAGLLVDQVVSW